MTTAVQSLYLLLFFALLERDLELGDVGAALLVVLVRLLLAHRQRQL